MSADAVILDERDNVATVLRRIEAGETLELGGAMLTIAEPIPLCHKLALRDIQAGGDIVKYGAVIGEAISAIPAGGYVHIHNVRSRRGR